jgi:hypothetical protein
MPVSPKQSALVLGVILGCAVSVGCSMPNVEPHAAVPGEHSRTILNGSDPTSEPPASRYRLAYESFYWNCVALKAQDVVASAPKAPGVHLSQG